MSAKCSCGITANGNAYCQQMSGDYDWQKWAAVCKEWINSGNIDKCGPSRKWDSVCVGSWSSQELMEEFRYWGWRL